MTDTWTKLHGRLLADALGKVLGKPTDGAMAFVRCLRPDVVTKLADEEEFDLPGWVLFRVGDSNNDPRTITADRAVERREQKKEATLLLVDTKLAGAGMDGIYSAAREVGESDLFRAANGLAAREVTREISSGHRKYAEQAVQQARGHGGRFSVSPWAEFSLYCCVADSGRHAGAFLAQVGLWPVKGKIGHESKDELTQSRRFVDQLLDTTLSGLGPEERIDALGLDASDEQLADLAIFLREVATLSIQEALEHLHDRDLWINSLRIKVGSGRPDHVKLVPWRAKSGKVHKWSGLVDDKEIDEPPELILHSDAALRNAFSKLEVRWKVSPKLPKGAVVYRVAVVGAVKNEERALREVVHTAATAHEKCVFNDDDFEDFSHGPAKVVLSVVEHEHIAEQESEEFVIRVLRAGGGGGDGGGGSGDSLPPRQGKVLRTFSEGLIDLPDREEVASLTGLAAGRPRNSKAFLSWRIPGLGRNIRVYRPPLVKEIEDNLSRKADWSSDIVGRWCVTVQTTGRRTGNVKYEPIRCPPEVSQDYWTRLTTASARLIAERFGNVGAVGQVYDDNVKNFNVVQEYLLAWSAVLKSGAAQLAHAHTVDVRSQSGKPIGLIVLPSHPLRMAWHVAYDNLVLNSKFEEGQHAEAIRKEYRDLDGAMFPALLPGLSDDHTFVFADTLGFHTVAMVPDTDREPKATVAILERSLEHKEGNEVGAVPAIAARSSEVLGHEVHKYLQCHETSRLLHVHALRAGDGRTIARALGKAAELDAEANGAAGNGTARRDPDLSFVLELYPSEKQQKHVVSGRFISDCQERRRRAVAGLQDRDRWMLESKSLPGGIRLPRLRWARKEREEPDSAAHVAVAFDIFESRVVIQKEPARRRPLHAYGLLSFFDRQYGAKPDPRWTSAVPIWKHGETHPVGRAHTKRLVDMQDRIHKMVAGALGDPFHNPELRTVISRESADSLLRLHNLCDWVITLDRNAGVEYFDSPRDNQEIYDAYVIDYVPEREDLGCVQLITSTTNLDEVQDLLDGVLDGMGLIRSRRNSEFIMKHVKALSGRLAIPLTGQRTPRLDLVALALCQSHCVASSDDDDECWISLRKGFFVPVDDVPGLLRPGTSSRSGNDQSRSGLVYVSAHRRKLRFQFASVTYRRHLRDSRSPELLNSVRREILSMQKRWNGHYGNHAVCRSFKAVRWAKLARVLRFYADRASRHELSGKAHDILVKAIDRMVERAGDSWLDDIAAGRGWIFCPELSRADPLKISPSDWDDPIFLFGPGHLPDQDSHPRTQAEYPEPGATLVRTPATGTSANESESKPDDPGTEPVSPNAEGSTVGEPVGADAVDSTDNDPVVVLGTDPYSDSDVSWKLTVEGNPHLLVAGLPGMGKTTCLLNVCSQMLAAGVRPIVFSYHQDIDQKLEALIKSPRFIDFDGLGFNPLQVMDRTSAVAHIDVAAQLRDIFKAIYPELGDLQAEAIRSAVRDSFVEQGWGKDRDPAHASEPEFKRFFEILSDTPKPSPGIKSLQARMAELNDYGFFDTGESHGSLWESPKPTVIRIHRTQSESLQNAFSSLILYGLYKDMFRRGTRSRITHAVIIDEAHRASRLKLIPTMAKECRKYGISLVLASQEAKDFHTSLFSAVANYLVLRLTDTDARALVRNVASSRQTRTLIDKIKQMDRFKALYFREGKTRPSSVDLLDYDAGGS